jgi:transposase-like protein
MVSLRWPDGVVKCPTCGSDKVTFMASRRVWQCKVKHPKRQFSVKVGTIFEDSPIGLDKWFAVIWMLANDKNGISSYEVARSVGVTQKTAWFMLDRIRLAMQTGSFEKLSGHVEVDETYIGGKGKNRHAKDRFKGGGTAGKIPVIGAISRKGNVICQMIENTDTPTLDRFVRRTVDEKVSLVATDEHSGYRLLSRAYPHETVRHIAGEYVRGEVHTQYIDSFWSLLKRGIIGTYHNVSKKYLPLYLAEFQFRYNNRREADIFGKAIAGA